MDFVVLCLPNWLRMPISPKKIEVLESRFWRKLLISNKSYGDGRCFWAPNHFWLQYLSVFSSPLHSETSRWTLNIDNYKRLVSKFTNFQHMKTTTCRQVYHIARMSCNLLLIKCSFLPQTRVETRFFRFTRTPKTCFSRYFASKTTSILPSLHGASVHRWKVSCVQL